MWPVLAVMLPLTMPIQVWEGVVMGATDFGFLARALLTSMISSLVVLVLVVPLDWDLSGVWWALVFFYVVRALHLIWWSSRPGSLYRGLTRLRVG